MQVKQFNPNKLSMAARKFLYSPKYRRKVIFQGPFKKFCKITQSEGATVKKRTTDTKMQLESEGYLSEIKNFPSVESVGKLKDIVNGAELSLRKGNVVSRSLFLLCLQRNSLLILFC